MGCVAFHIGFLKKESACCESLSHASGVPAPFHKGAFFVPGIDTGRGREVTTRRKLSCALTAAARRLWQGSLFCALLGEGKTNVSPINTGIIHTISKKIRGNSNLSVIFTGGVVKTTKIGIEIMAVFVYNYLIVVQGT